MAVYTIFAERPQHLISPHDHRHHMPDYDMSAYPYQRPVFGRHPYGKGHQDHRFYRRGVPNIAFSGVARSDDRTQSDLEGLENVGYIGIGIVCGIALIICAISLKVWWSKRKGRKEAAKARREAEELGRVEVREVTAKETMVTRPEASAKPTGRRDMALLTWA
ncbi:hypothetical protein LTR95_018961 [Oleoguttula sp. CCFEE 5521]